ncbi:MAG: DUF116 domain-containing protein [Desulfobacterales bacterium]
MTAAENMALDDTLLELKGEGATENTIRFLQFSPRAVLVGFHQSIEEEIRVDFCQTHGIDMNRRITGGGAIFFDENQLGWEVICDKSFFDVTVPNSKLFKTLCQSVILALDHLGLKADFRGRNDIEIDGRKISGTGGTESEEGFLFQGTMLVDFDVDTMLKSLRIPVEKLKAKEIDSVRERVTCLNWELGHTPDLQAIKDALRIGFEKQLNIKLELRGLTPVEASLFKKKLEFYQSPAWIHSVTPCVQRRQAIQSAFKTEAGLVRYTLAVDLARQRLKDLYITGDFLSFPNRGLLDLEASLRGSILDRKDLHRRIREFFEQGKICVPGMRPDDFIRPLDQAFEKIDISQFGIPLEYCNMISVANGSFAQVIREKPSVLLLPYCAKLTECDLRYEKDCRVCGEEGCSIGPAWALGKRHGMKVVTIVNFEDFWEELMRMKSAGVSSYIGCCCQPFYTKHYDDFTRSELPGILLDINNSTCYDLDQAKEAYAGRFENQTEVNLDLLEMVLNVQVEGQVDATKAQRHEEKGL